MSIAITSRPGRTSSKPIHSVPPPLCSGNTGLPRWRTTSTSGPPGSPGMWPTASPRRTDPASSRGRWGPRPSSPRSATAGSGRCLPPTKSRHGGLSKGVSIFSASRRARICFRPRRPSAGFSSFLRTRVAACRSSSPSPWNQTGRSSSGRRSRPRSSRSNPLISTS